jgi:predicted lipoprotein with Yx(FWY)xxD motif
MRRLSIAVTAIAVLCCGSLLASASAHRATTATAKAQLKTHKTKLGTFLVDAHGHTLYLFQRDKSSKSTCNGSCAKAWAPALTSGKATAGSGVKASLIGTTKRADGTMQVTYNGHPLYTYQTEGQGSNEFGAQWYVVAPGGKKIDDD